MSDREWRIKILSEVYDIPKEDIIEALDLIEREAAGVLGLALLSSILPQYAQFKDTASLIRVLSYLAEVATEIEKELSHIEGKEAVELALGFAVRSLVGIFNDMDLLVQASADFERRKAAGGGGDEHSD